MAVEYLNNVATQDNYVEALTVIFSRPRPAFSLNVYNKAIAYTLAITYADMRPGTWVWDSTEHHLAPSLSQFEDAVKEGLPAGALFAGVRIRTFLAGAPATVSV